MQLEKEKIDIRLIILNIILWIPLIILLIFIIGISKVEAESYWLNIYHDTSQQSLVDTAPSFPYYYENNALSCAGPGIQCPIPVGTISSYFTLINNMDNSHNYNWSFYSVLTYIAYAPITVDTSYMICYYRGTSERIPCNVNIRIYNQTSGNQYITEVIMEWNFENINPSDNKTGIQVRLPRVENTKLKKYDLTLSNTNFTITQGDQSAAIISANNANTQVIVNNNNENTTEIINNNDENTEKIIDNQNSNTEDITNAINNQYNTCNQYNIIKDSSSINNDINGYLMNDGTIREYNGYLWVTSEAYTITANKTYTITRYNWSTSQVRYCLYYNDGTISCNFYEGSITTFTPSQDGKLKFTYKGDQGSTVLTGEYCYNRLDEQTEEIKNLDDHMYVLMGGDFIPDPQPNTTTSDSAFNKEQIILNELDTNFTLATPTIDGNATSTIWDIVETLLFTNTIISGAVITILTMGILKLVLGR